MSPEELEDQLWINCWDPWSMVGNGHAQDASLDGAVGLATDVCFRKWTRTNTWSFKNVVLCFPCLNLGLWVWLDDIAID